MVGTSVSRLPVRAAVSTWRACATIRARPRASRPLLPRIAAHAVPNDITQALAGALTTTLGAAQYRRTEDPWGPGNAPEARIELACTDAQLLLRVHVRTGHPAIVDGDDLAHMPHNPLDNERADVNADGLQCHWGVAPREATGRPWQSAVLAVPLASGAGVRLSALEPGTVLPTARAVVHPEGWHMELRWPREALPVGHALRLGLAVNERPAERERRRGQLVLGGAAGFAYLRGDRLDPAESWTLALP
jgi:hypothetical protein